MNEDYLKGWRNFFIRAYFYLLNGVNFVSDFRNIGLAIFGLYITLKLENPYDMAFMLLGAILVLTPLGYFMVHKVSRVKEWLTTKYGSHYAIKNFDFVEAQYNTLKRIELLLEELNKNAKTKKLVTKKILRKGTRKR